ncbi:hypothetical protein [Mucilaginibacter celer]|uniref:Outer membrane protein beta-barrel domain-containing protein n=1 Tax=Mucilaginibacter celer TaxID=2305508 RepID=A0A494VP05_9SPHI|nr:hypothetical protein [Mucilaginibacter celer]AYL97167.1 hypothetical protein HYN43_018460 [Mucilaginibacter celer]
MFKPIRLIILGILFAFSSSVCFAQRGNQTSISVGTELNIPLNIGSVNYNKPDVVYQTGFGFNLKLEHPLAPSLHVTVNTGLVYFKSNLHYVYDYSAIDFPPGYIPHEDQPGPYVYLPVTAGLRYYPGKYFYLSAEAGSAFSLNNNSYTSFIYSGGAGAVVPIGKHQGIDFGVRFLRGYKSIDYDSPINQLGLNVAYKYRF